MTLPVIDLVFIIIVLGFGVFGFIKGFIDNLFGLGTPVIAIIVALAFKNHLTGPVMQLVKNQYAAVAIAFVLIFLVTFIVLKIIQKIIKSIFDTEIFSSLDRILGLLFGIVEGFAFVGLILFGLTVQPWFNVDKILEGSIFVKMLKPLIAIPMNQFLPAQPGNVPGPASEFVEVQG